MKEVGLKLNEKGLIPAIIQDEESGKLLMMAWMNLDTLRMTKETGYTHFYSRSRNEVWKKGETSGNTQKVKKIFYDCDADTILIMVDPAGPACHTGEETCFFSELGPDDSIVDATPEKAGENMLSKVYQVIQQRKRERPEGSYVAELFEKGESTILKKIGEESTEFVIGCKNGDEKEIVYEAADLWFHTLVAMAQHDVPPEKIFEELKKRFK
ncbi:MAG: bifunctional phosphoribosyl-AMP cyclohydrolase/phosphoribosyl-ATP diphosphatase HisIE [Nitrospinota bacterium]